MADTRAVEDSNRGRGTSALYVAHGERLSALAALICGDRDEAARIARRAIARAAVTWQDLRDSEMTELHLARAVVKRACKVPSPGSVAGRSRRDDFLSLPARQRAAVILRYHLGLSATAAGDILLCSASGAESLARRGLDTWERSAQDEKDCDLGALLRAGAAPAIALPPPRRNVVPRLLRAGVAVVALVASAIAVVGLVAASEAFVGRPEQPAQSEGLDRQAQYERVDDGIVPGDDKLDWCPEPESTIDFGPEAARRAGRVAVRFDAAIVHNDRLTLARLIDPTPSALNLVPHRWAATGLAEGLKVTESRSAAGDDIATGSCGALVAERSWKVVMHDSTGEPPRGVAAFYLVRRSTGWKVWGSY